MEVKPYKMKDETWGVKVKTDSGEEPVAVGEVVTVVTSTGKSWPTQIAAIKWSGADPDGSAVALCSTTPVAKSAKPTREDARQESLLPSERIAQRFDAGPVAHDLDPNDNWVDPGPDDDLPF